MNFKRLFTVVFSLCLLLALLTVSASAADTVDEGDFGTGLHWALDSEGTLTVSGSGSMDFPSTGSIPWYSSYRNDIVHVNIESGVTNIGDMAFFNCGNLRYIHIGTDVTSIGNNAFDSCSSLLDVNISANDLTSIGDYAFLDCEVMRSLSLPRSLTSIGNYAFNNCNSLSDVYYAGLDTDWSGTVTVGVNNSALSGATFHFRSGYCGENLTWSLDSEGVLTISGSGAMENYLSSDNVPWAGLRSGIIKVSVGLRVTEIGKYSFFGCNAMTDLYIPETVSQINIGAFSGCENLSVVHYYGSQDDWDQIAIDSYNYGLDDAEIEYGCVRETLYDGDFDDGNHRVHWVIDDAGKLTISGSGAIPDCDAFHSAPWKQYRANIFMVYVGNGITSIGRFNFFEHDHIEAVRLPAVLQSIGAYSFDGCTALKNVRFPSGVTSIGESAFYGCSGLESISLSSGMTAIAERTFMECSSLSSVDIPSDIESMGLYAFSECTSLKNIVLPNNLKTLGQGVFQGCTGLTEISIPAELASIGTQVFSGCTGLKKVTVVNGITFLSGSMFYGCSALTEVNLPQSLKMIETSAFARCTSLKYISIPDHVTSIGSNVFEGCSSLNRVAIPSSAGSIGGYLLHGCSNLEAVYYSGTYEEWKKIMLYNNTVLQNAKMIYRSGICGENLVWTLDPEDTLTISGNGGTSDYSKTDAVPWNGKASQIKRVITEGERVVINPFAFFDCKNITDLYLGSRDCTLMGYNGSLNDDKLNIHFIASKNLLAPEVVTGHITPKLMRSDDAVILDVSNSAAASKTANVFAACYGNGRFISCRMITLELFPGESRKAILNMSDLTGSGIDTVKFFTTEGCDVNPSSSVIVLP